MNHRPAVETGFLFLKIINYVIFALTILLKMRHTFVLECPLCNLTRDNFLLLFEKVVLGSLKCFFQLNQQFEISLYLKEAIALCHSWELVGLKHHDVLSVPLAFELHGFYKQLHFIHNHNDHSKSHINMLVLKRKGKNIQNIHSFFPSSWFR